MHMHKRPLYIARVLYRTPASDVTERNSTELSDIFGSEPNLIAEVQNLGHRPLKRAHGYKTAYF